ncbi:MAG TPA: TlpA disulfide reductase family protein [Thermoanaerobaculia bacterium]
MRKFARFAALSLSALSLGATALPLLAADVRSYKETRQLDAVWPKKAALRVVNVWATWCAPCVAEMPDLRAIDAAFGEEVALVGVTLDNLLPDGTPQKVATFLDRHKIAFPNVYWSGSPDALAEHLRFSGEMPITIVYDARGRELWRHEGRLERDKAIARLRELLRRTR